MEEGMGAGGGGFCTVTANCVPDKPGIMQSSKMRSGRTFSSATHFNASLPEVSQCSCTTTNQH